MADTFRASRWTGGNRIFPATLRIEPDGIHFEKRHVFSARQEIINYHHIASVQIQSGMLFATLIIETSGGSDPVEVRGLWKKDANAVRDAIQRLHASLPAGEG